MRLALHPAALLVIQMAVATTAACAAPKDLTLPLNGGTIVLKKVSFIHQDRFGDWVPDFSFDLENHTATWWRLELSFRISATCPTGKREWRIPVEITVGWREDEIVGNWYRGTFDDLAGKVDGCRMDDVSATIELASSDGKRIASPEREAELKAEELRAALAKRKAQAEQERLRSACSALYLETIDRRLQDLTVREHEYISKCRQVGLYRAPTQEKRLPMQ